SLFLRVLPRSTGMKNIWPPFKHNCYYRRNATRAQYYKELMSLTASPLRSFKQGLEQCAERVLVFQLGITWLETALGADHARAIYHYDLRNIQNVVFPASQVTVHAIRIRVANGIGEF